MEARVQNFENHASTDWLFVTSALVASLAGAAAVEDAVVHPSVASITQALFGALIVVLFLRLRRYALTLQDRVIRLEAQLRFERALPAELFARFPELTIKQIVALRFASDEELPALFQAVVDRRIVAPKDIKKSVKRWRADWLRV